MEPCLSIFFKLRYLAIVCLKNMKAKNCNLSFYQRQANDPNLEEADVRNHNLPITTGGGFAELTDEVKDMSMQDDNANECDIDKTKNHAPHCLTGALAHEHNICQKENSRGVAFSDIPGKV